MAWAFLSLFNGDRPLPDCRADQPSLRGREVNSLHQYTCSSADLNQTNYVRCAAEVNFVVTLRSTSHRLLAILINERAPESAATMRWRGDGWTMVDPGSLVYAQMRGMLQRERTAETKGNVPGHLGIQVNHQRLGGRKRLRLLRRELRMRVRSASLTEPHQSAHRAPGDDQPQSRAHRRGRDSRAGCGPASCGSMRAGSMDFSRAA